MRTPAGLQTQGKVLWKKIIGEFGEGMTRD